MCPNIFAVKPYVKVGFILRPLDTEAFLLPFIVKSLNHCNSFAV